MDGVHDKVMAFPSSRVTDEKDLITFNTGEENIKSEANQLQLYLVLCLFSTEFLEVAYQL